GHPGVGVRDDGHAEVLGLGTPLGTTALLLRAKGFLETQRLRAVHRSAHLSSLSSGVRMSSGSFWVRLVISAWTALWHAAWRSSSARRSACRYSIFAHATRRPPNDRTSSAPSTVITPPPSRTTLLA